MQVHLHNGRKTGGWFFVYFMICRDERLCPKCLDSLFGQFSHAQDNGN